MLRTTVWVLRLALAMPAISATSVATASETSDAAGLKHFEQGRAAFEAGQFETALTSFKASLQVLPSPNTRLYIARCYRALGKTASAYTSFSLAAREGADRLNATGEKRYQATVDAATSEAKALEAKVPHLTLQVAGEAPAGLAVSLDGSEIASGSLNTAVAVDPGDHVVKATARRHKPFEAKFTISVAEQKALPIILERLPTATLSLAFKQKPSGMSVEVDGAPTDPTQSEAPREVDAGQHSVVVRAPGYQDFKWQGTLDDRGAQQVNVLLTPAKSSAGASSGGTPPWLFIGVAVVSVAALGAGAYFAIDADNRADTEKGKDPLTRDPGEREDIRSEATTANVLFVGGAAVAAGAGVLAFTTNWGGPARPPSKAKLTPIVSPQVAGLLATGRF
jgi:hypothetical protein